VPVTIGRRPPMEPGPPADAGPHPANGAALPARQPPAHACDEHPLAGSGLAGF
jgi:hypothetical protein